MRSPIGNGLLKPILGSRATLEPLGIGLQLADGVVRSLSAAGWSALLATALLGDTSVEKIWETTDPATSDRPLAIETESAEITIRLAVTPTLQAATGVCVLEVDAATAQTGDRRMVKTTVTLAGDDRGAVLELPAARPGSKIRLIVLMAIRG